MEQTDNEQQDNKKKLNIKWFVVITAGIVLLTGVGFFVVYLYSYYRKGIFNVLNQVITVLCIGVDDSNTTLKGKDPFSGKADAIVVLAYYPKTKRMAMISIPRNTRVRVNYGGAEVFDTVSNIYGKTQDIGLLQKISQNLTGLSIPNYVVCNYDAISETVDLLGGVDVFAEVDMAYKDRAGDLYIDIPFGHHYYYGDKALDFLRYLPKQNLYADYQRMSRAQEFICTILKKHSVIVKFVTHPKIFKILLEKVKTNITVRDIFGGIRFLQDFHKTKVSSAMILGKRSKNLLIPDHSGTRRKVSQIIDELKREYVAFSKKVNVSILNACGVPGLARHWQIKLDSPRINVVEIGSHYKSDLQKTVILDKKGFPDEAQEIARIMGCNRVYSKIDLIGSSDIQIILGKDSHK